MPGRGGGSAGSTFATATGLGFAGFFLALGHHSRIAAGVRLGYYSEILKIADGRENYILNFNTPGGVAITNDLEQGFRLNQLSLATDQGENFALAGNRLALMPNRAAGIQPAIHVTCNHKIGVISAPLELTGDVAVNMNPYSEVTLAGQISGDGRLVLNSTDPNPRNDNYHYMACRLRIDGNSHRPHMTLGGSRAGGSLPLPASDESSTAVRATGSLAATVWLRETGDAGQGQAGGSTGV